MRHARSRSSPRPLVLMTQENKSSWDIFGILLQFPILFKLMVAAKAVDKNEIFLSPSNLFPWSSSNKFYTLPRVHYFLHFTLQSTRRMQINMQWTYTESKQFQDMGFNTRTHAYPAMETTHVIISNPWFLIDPSSKCMYSSSFMTFSLLIALTLASIDQPTKGYVVLISYPIPYLMQTTGTIHYKTKKKNLFTHVWSLKNIANSFMTFN